MIQLTALLAMITPTITKMAYSAIGGWISKLVGDASNTLTEKDGEFLSQFIGDRATDLLELTIYQGIDALFIELRNEAAKTDNELDDLKVQAIESAVRAGLSMLFGQRG